MQSTPERQSREIRAARVKNRPAGLGATLFALAILFLLAWVFFIRTPAPVPAPATEGIQGTYTWRSGEGGVDEDGTFSAVASGNAGGKARVPADTTVSSYWPPESAYDARSRAETTLGDNDGRARRVTRTVGAWPPVWRVATRSPLDYQGLAAIVRSAVEDGDDDVGIKALKDGDREVWRAALTIDDTEVLLVVDQLSGIVTWYSDADATFTAKVSWSSPPPADEDYVVAAPAGTKVSATTDAEYSYVASLAAAERVTGRELLKSTLTPDGWTTAAIATRERPGGASSGGDQAPRAAEDGREQEVAVLFTRGLSWCTLLELGPESTRDWRASVSETVSDPLTEELSVKETTLQFGAFKGRVASTWFEKTGPTLFVSDGSRSVYVTGALTRQELITLAEGLQPLDAGGSGSSGSASPSPSPSSPAAP